MILIIVLTHVDRVDANSYFIENSKQFDNSLVVIVAYFNVYQYKAVFNYF